MPERLELRPIKVPMIIGVCMACYGKYEPYSEPGLVYRDKGTCHICKETKKLLMWSGERWEFRKLGQRIFQEYLLCHQKKQQLQS